MPQSPQPTGPAMYRRRRASASDRSPLSHIRSSMPSGCSATSRLSISSGRSTMRSLRLKPTAKSRRSAGVAIITAWVPPL